MTINYKGKFSDRGGKLHRIAEIDFQPKEEIVYKKISQLLQLKGWQFEQPVEGWAFCEVANFDEYRILVNDYKAVKKSVTFWRKFGF